MFWSFFRHFWVICSPFFRHLVSKRRPKNDTEMTKNDLFVIFCFFGAFFGRVFLPVDFFNLAVALGTTSHGVREVGKGGGGRGGGKIWSLSLSLSLFLSFFLSLSLSLSLSFFLFLNPSLAVHFIRFFSSRLNGRLRMKIQSRSRRWSTVATSMQLSLV